MKTKILLITTLIAAGLMFTSCQKDNALTEDFSSMEVKAGPWDEENDTGDIPTKLQNFPDPFARYTTIQYNLKKDARVSLIVYKENSQLVTVLVNGVQKKGKHQVKFDSKELKPGIYFAELKVNSAIHKDKMTKKNLLQEDNGIISD